MGWFLRTRLFPTLVGHGHGHGHGHDGTRVASRRRRNDVPLPLPLPMPNEPFEQGTRSLPKTELMNRSSIF